VVTCCVGGVGFRRVVVTESKTIAKLRFVGGITPYPGTLGGFSIFFSFFHSLSFCMVAFLDLTLPSR